jgi:hypothetical protein
MIAKYSKKFPYAPYLNEDIGYDISLPDNATDEEMIAATIRLNSIAERAFKAMNPQATIVATDFHTGEQGIQEVQADRRVGLIADDILSSPDIKTLESYRLLARAKPELREAYDKRLKELS